MAKLVNDSRKVTIEVTQVELTDLLGKQAKAAGLIDFNPDRSDIIDHGDGRFDIHFYEDSGLPV